MDGRSKLCDPVNTLRSVALRDCLGCKNALYKYLILHFTISFTLRLVTDNVTFNRYQRQR